MAKPLKTLVAPQGFEPRYAAPEAAVLPLNEGAMRQTGKSRQAPNPSYSKSRTDSGQSEEVPPSTLPAHLKRLLAADP